ncbi:ribosome biogenesis protein BRX1 homolog 1-like isoform X1 [Cucumis melo]|uniref:Ribosome biogenesis protein BRX1 homolog 1-like isoform X1 n=1 Tax=Cucumis melo TaxID=3656 RepID=A0ABM3KHH5_CUCME|nr:ribosome biogenesis protein BRX1 homolog 1-like isoform X1 [Cucumis melo]XP_050937233.1 ribosome biogenesis protein BRX1 homolog 1-like isoform X1 [Cucumis melo]XP_050937234.1 ribosome biogenesis protein BRX1 homolog 1-like isoform X1 [Cucumis melo]
MAKKRKHSETVPTVSVKKDENALERPKRTLMGWKDKEVTKKSEAGSDHAVFRNKEKVLVTCSRRINFRYRHLMLNMVSLLPHCKKDNKVESRSSKGATLNELVELKGCSSSLFFECRKHKDLYLWMAKCPSGPSVKFLVNAVHTMEELKLTGNHLKGSRPILTFSSNFDKDVHWKLLKEMIIQIFGTPKEHRHSKPYHDHVFVFSIVDDHIWFRNYQISVPHNESDKVARGGLDKMTLIEVGPRFCLNPIKIFGGSFGGPTLYENPLYVSPNQVRLSNFLVIWDYTSSHYPFKFGLQKQLRIYICISYIQKKTTTWFCSMNSEIKKRKPYIEDTLSMFFQFLLSSYLTIDLSIGITQKPK